MLVLNGVFKDNIFIPDNEAPIPDGTRATVSFEESPQKKDLESMQQKKAWHDFFEGIRSLDEELPAEFDKIVSKNLVFKQADVP